MSLDLNQLLDLPHNFSRIKLLTITGDDLNNCSFLLHTLISSKVRSCRNNNVNSGQPFLVLILFNQSYTHYSSVAAKSFGINLKALKDSGQLIVMDVIGNLNQYMDADEERFDFNKLCSQIFATLSKIPQVNSGDENDVNSLVVIDDISTLLSLQLSVATVYKFTSRLRSFSFNRNMSLIVQSSIDCDQEDEEMNLLADSISCVSDITIESRKLETGFSQTIDGTLSVLDHKNVLAKGDMSKKKYHFKTMERNTKIFVPGSK